MRLLLLLLICLSACSLDKKEKYNSFPFNSNTSKNRIVAIQPFEKFPIEFQDSIQKAIEQYYGFETIIYSNKKIPKSFFINVKSPRYRADSIIYALKKTKADSIDFILALTNVDISCTKKDQDGNVKKPLYKYNDWGILGLGFRPGVSCVVSSFRVKGVSKNKQIERLQKICLHELGHNLGLAHCTSSKKCVMRDAAESVKTVDLVEMALCEKCWDRIHTF